MTGVLRITYLNGEKDLFEVEPIDADEPAFINNLKAFVQTPTVTLALDEELVVIPSTSIQSISITFKGSDRAMELLEETRGVLVGAKRLVG